MAPEQGFPSLGRFVGLPPGSSSPGRQAGGGGVPGQSRGFVNWPLRRLAGPQLAGRDDPSGAWRISRSVSLLNSTLT